MIRGPADGFEVVHLRLGAHDLQEVPELGLLLRTVLHLLLPDVHRADVGLQAAHVPRRGTGSMAAESQQESRQETTKDNHKEHQKGTPKGKPKETPREKPKGTPIDEPRGKPKGKQVAKPRGKPKGTSTGKLRGTPKPILVSMVQLYPAVCDFVCF